MTNDQTPAKQIAVPTIKLPNWHDAGSISSFIVSIGAVIVSLLTMLQVGMPAHTSETLSSLAGTAGLVIAAIVQAFNQHRITTIHTAAIQAGCKVVAN